MSGFNKEAMIMNVRLRSLQLQSRAYVRMDKQSHLEKAAVEAQAAAVAGLLRLAAVQCASAGRGAP